MNEEKSTPSVADRSTEFIAVQGGGASTDAGTILVWAYVLMWAAVFTFVWLTSRRQRRLEQRLVELEAALARRDAAS